MPTYYEFSQEINRLKRANNFSAVLDLFVAHKDNFSKQQIANDNYMINNIIASLRKIDNAHFVFNFLNEFNIIINENTNEMVLNAYGWAIYDICKSEVSHENYNKEKILDLIKYPLYLLSLKQSDYSYSVISNIFRLVLKVEKHKLNKNWNFMNAFCNLFNPDIFSLECGTMEIRGKLTEFASDKENWYATKSKALFQLNMFQECYEVSKLAITNIDNFHYSNDLWFARRIALSKKELGNIDEAIEELEQIYKRKNEWFIKKELAELYFEINDLEKSFYYAIDAICKNGFSKLEFKIGLVLLLANIFKAYNKTEFANKHFLLLKIIREKNGFKIPQELQNELNQINIENINLETLENELIKYWKSFQSKTHNPQERKTLLQGYIKKILHDNERGKNGFISSKEKEYYFLLPRDIVFIDNIELNTKVQFEVVKLSDGKERAKILKVLR
ncbi:hypothetical protein KKC13_13260 [bacterium]|nr:hypothetical protein [bacterium]MBU1957696.1 hypothetical protein [bacterium]